MRSVLIRIALLSCTPWIATDLHAQVVAGAGLRSLGDPTGPRFELTMSALEFDAVHASAATGVGTYGGDAGFTVRIAKEGERLVWHVTILSPVLLDAWSIWVQQATARLLGQLDLASLDDDGLVMLGVMQSVNAKLADARATTLFDDITVSGTLGASEGRFVLENALGVLTAAGDAARLDPFVGKDVVITGPVRSRQVIDVEVIREQRVNTLELFVMSMCPYGRMAEDLVLRHLARPDLPSPAPRLDVRYIFYRDDSSSPPAYSSLNGEDEVHENLVQMLIRDMYPEQFLEYLGHRIRQPESSWKSIAEASGLEQYDVSLVEQRVELEREALIEQEYGYAVETYGIRDGSPTYIWEGIRVDGLQGIPAFGGLGRS